MSINVQLWELRFIENKTERILIQQVIAAVNEMNLVTWMKEYKGEFFHTDRIPQLAMIREYLNKMHIQFTTFMFEVALLSVRYILMFGFHKFKEARIKNN